MKLFFSHRLKENNLTNLVSLHAKKQYFLLHFNENRVSYFINSQAIMIVHDMWEESLDQPFKYMDFIELPLVVATKQRDFVAFIEWKSI